MSNILKFLRGLLFLLNPFKKKIKIKIVGPDWSVHEENAKLTHIPRPGEKIFFEEGGKLFDVRRVIHYYNFGWQIIYVMITPHDFGKVEIDFDLNG